MFDKLRVLASRIRGFFAIHRLDRDFEQELDSHLAMLTDEYIRRGMPPAEARRAARLRLGSPVQLRESHHDLRSLPFLESVLADIRFALRMLRKSPGFTAVAVLTLALGIGANTAIFSVVNAVLLKPLPFPQPDRIVRLVDTSPGGNGTTTTVPRFMVWREQTDALQDITAYDFAGPGVNLMSGDAPEQVRAIHVSADYFRLFGASVTAGRTFTADEDRPGGPQAVVITNGLWRRQFASDSGLLGKTIDLGGDPHTVVGVLDPNFKSDPPADVYLPMQADPNSTMMGNSIFVAARLKPGISLSQAKAAMKLAAERYRRKFPQDMDPDESATAVPMLDMIVGDIQTPLLVLSGAVIFVLLIACVNVANLQLARSLARTREVAIRVALGAGRRRILRQILTENSLLFLAGGALGLFLGYAVVRALLATAPAGTALIDPDRIPRIGEHGSAVPLDWHVLAFTFLAAVTAGILFGLLPVFYVTRSDVSAALHGSGIRAAGGPRHKKIRSTLAIAEIALSLVLLVGAFLMVREFVELRAVNPGFDGHNVLTMEISLPESRFDKTASVAQVVHAAEQRVESLPGVEAAAYTNALPLQLNMGLGIRVEGHPNLDSRNDAVPQWREVSPHFFDVFRVPMLWGRMFTNGDDRTAPLVALINEAMAKKYWPNEDPVGQRITIAKGMSPATDEPPRQIVGVVADFKNIDVEHASVPCVYVPVAQVVDGLTALIDRNVPTNWVVRTKVEPYSLSADIQRELRIATGGLPVARIRSMHEVMADSTQRTDFNRTLLTLFAGIGLLLAAIGIYGVMVYSSQQRTQEIGIRMALGALPGSVCNMVLLQGTRLLLIGIALGVAGSLALTRVTTNVLGVVKTNDYYAANAQRLQQHNIGALIFAIVMLTAVALLACWIPARRAMRVDPMVALRHE